MKKKIKVILILSLILFFFYSLLLHYTSGKGMGPQSWTEILKYSWVIVLASIATAFFIVYAIEDDNKEK